MSDVTVFDIETFNDATAKEHLPYALGWYSNEEGYNYYDDPDNFLKSIETKTRRHTFIAYYGSGFDFFFLLRALLRNGFDIKDIDLKDSRIVILEFCGANKIVHRVFNIGQFVMCSLAKACHEFSIYGAISKTDFLHHFIRSWNDLEYVSAWPDAKYYTSGHHRPTLADTAVFDCRKE